MAKGPFKLKSQSAVKKGGFKAMGSSPNKQSMFFGREHLLKLSEDEFQKGLSGRKGERETSEYQKECSN